MLIRVLFTAVALVVILAVYLKCPWVENSVLVFASAVSVGSIFVPYLGKMAIATLIILLAMMLTFLVSAGLSSVGFQPVFSKFEVAATFVLVTLLGVSSTLLYIYADYRVWQLLGSLGIFLVAVFLHFYVQEARLQGVGLILGIFAAVPWLVGLALGMVVRH